jgi:hypothetical protein
MRAQALESGRVHVNVRRGLSGARGVHATRCEVPQDRLRHERRAGVHVAHE